jgi:hypothetical protein
MTPKELCDIGLQVQSPEWPRGTRQATKDAFEAGKQAAVQAILDTITNSGRANIFWEVRPKPFSPPAWMVEDQ